MQSQLTLPSIPDAYSAPTMAPLLVAAKKLHEAKSLTTVYDINLVIERPVVIHVSDQKHTAGQKVNDPTEPFAHVHSMNAENAQERQQYPCNRIIARPFLEPEIGLAVHRRNEKEINDPSD
jgi:hypothetical protein